MWCRVCFTPLSRPLPYLQFVDVRVENPVHEADARGLVGVLVWQLDVHFPDAAFEGGCSWDDA